MTRIVVVLLLLLTACPGPAPLTGTWRVTSDCATAAGVPEPCGLGDDSPSEGWMRIHEGGRVEIYDFAEDLDPFVGELAAGKICAAIPFPVCFDISLVRPDEALVCLGDFTCALFRRD